MNLPRIGRKYGFVTLEALNHDKTPATVAGIEVAVLHDGLKPDATTVWVAMNQDGTEYSYLFSGPDAPAYGGPHIVVPTEGVSVWCRITDDPEIDVVKVGRITVT